MLIVSHQDHGHALFIIPVARTRLIGVWLSPHPLTQFEIRILFLLSAPLSAPDNFSSDRDVQDQDEIENHALFDEDDVDPAVSVHAFSVVLVQGVAHNDVGEQQDTDLVVDLLTVLKLRLQALFDQLDAQYCH